MTAKRRNQLNAGLIVSALLGLDDLAADPNNRTNPQRAGKREELGAIVQRVLVTRSCRAWEHRLVEKGVPAAAVQSCLEFLDDPQVEALNMNPIIRHAAIGAMRVAGVPLHFSATPGAIQRAAPLLGEHSAEQARADPALKLDTMLQQMVAGVPRLEFGVWSECVDEFDEHAPP